MKTKKKQKLDRIPQNLGFNVDIPTRPCDCPTTLIFRAIQGPDRLAWYLQVARGKHNDYTELGWRPHFHPYFGPFNTEREALRMLPDGY